MIILHAAIYGSQVYVWGESPPKSDAGPRKRPGRKPKAPLPEAMPYDTGIEELAEALEGSGLDFTAGKLTPHKMIAWIPTVKNTPVPSSPLIAELPPAEETASLAPWEINAFPFPVNLAAEFLCACADRSILAPGVIIGRDLAFLATALRFAGGLAARQQFLPAIREKDKAYFACWEPIFSNLDHDRLMKLASSMPHACRSLGREAASPPETSPVSLLSAFIDEMVDNLVRSSALELSAKSRATLKKIRKAIQFDSLHDQWLDALQSPDGILEGNSAELAQIAAQVREWHRPITISAAGAFRLCFRLEEPEADVADDTPVKRRRSTGPAPAPAPAEWKIRYLLQAADDPSLFIPADVAWTAKGRKASVLKRDDFNAREYLLSALGQASGICPRIETSLRTSAPDGYRLDTPGAYEFLIEKAWALEQAGYGVLLPAWWTRKGTKLRLTTHAKVKSPKMQGGGTLSLGEIIHFDWEVALGDETLTLQELQTLAGLKMPLVKIRGQWVQIDAEEIQAALDFWKKKAEGEATLRDVVQMALGAQRAHHGIPFEGVKATGWVGDLLARLEGRAAFEELPPPEGFKGSLRPYQKRGYSWLGFLRQWGLGACLADDMGLGKTIQTLALIERDRESSEKRPVLLICPTSVVSNWEKEAARFTPGLSVMIHHGGSRMKGRSFKAAAKKHAIVISSYALLYRDYEMLNEVPWAGIILDEAQNIKNSETKQSKAARSLKGDYRIALTGTPVENNVGDLWSIMEFLNPSFLGTPSEFKRSFFIPIQANRDTEATERLRHLTGPFILRRMKTDKSIISDLPEKMEMNVFCNLTREQASLYEAVVKDASEALNDSEGIQRKGVVLATLSKLKQVCNHPAQFLGDNSPAPGRSGKLIRLTEMIEEILEVGERTLIFSQFSEMGEILRRYLQETFGREVLFLHGQVLKKHRDRMVERFQTEKDGPRIFILSLKAGGTGLNLTRANHVFHFDRWWNPAVENQATDRAFRIGQTKNVQVHKFVCAGTLEERINDMIESKKEIAEGIVGTGEGWLTELSTADLKALFALGKDAVAE